MIIPCQLKLSMKYKNIHIVLNEFVFEMKRLPFFSFQGMYEILNLQTVFSVEFLVLSTTIIQLSAQHIRILLKDKVQHFITQYYMST